MKTTPHSPFIVLALFALMAILITPKAQAALTGTPSYSVQPVGIIGGNYSLGFEFIPSSTFDVSALGYWDNGNNGLIASHQVAIYYGQSYGGFSAGDLVTGASVTVQIADSGSSLNIGTAANGYYAYHELASNVTLVAGVHYVIAGCTVGVLANSQFGSGDNLGYGNLANPVYNQITVVRGLASGTSNTDPNVFYPTGVDNTNIYSNPNFLIADPVPEPSSVALLSIGGVAFLTWRMRRRLRKSS